MERHEYIQKTSDRIQPIQLIEVGKQPQVPAPLIRITTCGLLTLEVVEEVVSVDPPLARYTSFTSEQLHGRGTAPALTLLKLLVSRPERFALKDWLTDAFCHDREIFSDVRLDNIVSQLRSLLCPPAYAELRTHLVTHLRGSPGSGNGYQLAAYPLIWVDADALAWLVEQAVRMERFADDPQPYWENAYALTRRGPYLPDEIYSSWSTTRRDEVAGLLRQSVQALAQLYLMRHGTSGEEEALLLLRSFWQDHPFEEDVLRSLMELLRQRDRYHEALTYYERLQKLLEQEERQPDRQTQDLALYLREKQIHRVPQVSNQINRPSSVSPLPEDRKRFSFSQAGPPNRIEAGHVLEGDIMDQRRRQLLKQALKGTGVAILASQGSEMVAYLTHTLTRPLDFTEQGSVLHVEEVLSIYTAYVPIYWRMYFDGHIAEIKNVLPECLATLSALATHHSSHQKQAASLASKATQLACMLALQDQQFGSALLSARQGIQYGQLAEDPNVQVAALIRKALVYFYLNKPEQKLQAYEDALPYAVHVSPLLQGRVYVGLAEAHSHLVELGDSTHTTEAQRFLDLGCHVFPTVPKDDLHYAYTHFGSPKGQESVIYLGLQQPEKAWNILAAQSHVVPSGSVPERVELYIRQTRACIALGEMEQSCALLETALSSVLALGSHLRYQETHELYHHMRTKWPDERQIKELGDVFEW